MAPTPKFWRASKKLAARCGTRRSPWSSRSPHHDRCSSRRFASSRHRWQSGLGMVHPPRSVGSPSIGTAHSAVLSRTMCQMPARYMYSSPMTVPTKNVPRRTNAKCGTAKPSVVRHSACFWASHVATDQSTNRRAGNRGRASCVPLEWPHRASSSHKAAVRGRGDRQRVLWSPPDYPGGGGRARSLPRSG